jgi:flagellar motor switch/type III secretory pathway protein FliN
MADAQPAKVPEVHANIPPSGDPFAQVMLVPATLTVEVPVVNLSVRELFRLEKGSVVASAQSAGANLPLFVSKKLIAWGEFQVVGENLALRVAELG